MTAMPEIRSFLALTEEAAVMFDSEHEDGSPIRCRWARQPFIVQAMCESESGKIYIRLGRWLTATESDGARVPYSILVGIEHVDAAGVFQR